ncbi:APC family permease [Actinocatenispora comari]|uniref:Amino acid transporter n=1 Tax=Actinocatenispora comari TaxID=2807577 RepID=A0A8J4A6M3_9ACTN|nr:APC family permease [Actinocatenispora comari]GIL25243.1 amino acid transporter [Actinocatenispora comari]
MPTPETTAPDLEQLGYRQELRRSMSVGDVVVFGLIYMVPMAPLPVFGTIVNFSAGQVALVYLVAAFAMVFSALSYKEMAVRFPIAGSVYSYVRMGLHSFAGFLAGWAILLDYLLLPALLSVFAAAAMVSLWSVIPAWVWIVVFVALAAAVNLAGITVTATMNKLFLAVQLAVLGIFCGWVLVDVARGRASLELFPLYNSDGFSWSIVFGAIPIAALSFIGFDAISTLNEEARGGGRAVSKATMIVLVAVAVIFFLQVYLAACYVPRGRSFPAGDAENNAFYDIAGQVVGPWFKVVITLTSALIAIFANSIASQATSSRLVFSMARDGQLPRLLATVSRTRQVPRNALLFVAGLSLVVGILGTRAQTLLTTLVTFGALTAYILLHVSVFVHLGVRGRSRNVFLHWVSPVIGTAVLGYALWNANTNAKVVGVCWLAVGAAIGLSFRLRARRRPAAERPDRSIRA